jgi:hypothetical protein
MISYIQIYDNIPKANYFLIFNFLRPSFTPSPLHPFTVSLPHRFTPSLFTEHISSEVFFPSEVFQHRASGV